MLTLLTLISLTLAENDAKRKKTKNQRTNSLQRQVNFFLPTLKVEENVLFIYFHNYEI